MTRRYSGYLITSRLEPGVVTRIYDNARSTGVARKQFQAMFKNKQHQVMHLVRSVSNMVPSLYLSTDLSLSSAVLTSHYQILHHYTILWTACPSALLGGQSGAAPHQHRLSYLRDSPISRGDRFLVLEYTFPAQKDFYCNILD